MPRIQFVLYLAALFLAQRSPLRGEPAGGTIAGRVVDAQEHPVAGAELFAQFRSDVGVGASRTGESHEQRLGTTSEDGTFHVDDLAPGSFDLVVRASGYVEGRLDGLRPEDGRRTGLRVVLAEGARITGRVLDPAGEPAGDLTVVLRRGRPGARRDRSRKLFRVVRVSTDRSGRYRLSGLDPGTYRLTIEGSAAGTASAEVKVAERETRSLDFRLAPAQKVEVSGFVRDESGQPVGDVRVSVVANPAPNVETSYGTSSLDDGSFVIRRFPRRVPRRFRQRRIRAAREGARVRVHGTPVSGLEVRMARTGLVESPAMCAAWVWDRTSSTSSKSRPRLLASRRCARSSASNRRSASTGSNPGPGAARHARRPADRVDRYVVAGRQTELDLDFSGPLVITRDGHDRRPASCPSPADSAARRGERPLSGHTGDDGSFRLEGLSPGTWSLVFVGADGRGAMRAIQVPRRTLSR